MTEIDIQALRLTQQAVLRLINQVAEKTEAKTEPEFLLAAEVAKLLRVSTWHFYHVYRSLGLVPDRRFGRKLRFERGRVMQLLAKAPRRRGRPPKRLNIEPPEGGSTLVPIRGSHGTILGGIRRA
ncbi:MAG: hypothetical protein KGM24_11910 [Elusimicrobia bacterium]|nr:hypothetical protein [Elusimicrobiota bacterium]